eukprot:1793543-Pleurochrysis_carterae.AAC.1
MLLLAGLRSKGAAYISAHAASLSAMRRVHPGSLASRHCSSDVETEAKAADELLELPKQRKKLNLFE